MKIVCAYCGSEICFNYEDIEEICGEAQADWRVTGENGIYNLVVKCPYCGNEIYFTGKGESEMMNTLIKDIREEKDTKIEVVGAFAFKTENIDEFPEDAELVAVVHGEDIQKFSDIPEAIQKEIIDKGANIIAIGTEDEYELYKIE